MAVFPDLSKTVTLKHVKLVRMGESSTVRWITMALRTVKSRNLESITIAIDEDFPEAIDDEAHREWKNLDRLFVQFWTSRSIRPQVMNAPGWREETFRGNARQLLPESTGRGIVDMVEVSF